MGKRSILEQAITAFYDGLMDKLAREYKGDYAALIVKWQELHALYLKNANSVLKRWSEEATAADPEQPDLEEITADTVVVEVADKRTGKIFRRTLPIGYVETDNGIRLSGDTPEGTPGHLAFLSDRAVSGIKGLTGGGPDEHRCQDD